MRIEKVENQWTYLGLKKKKKLKREEELSGREERVIPLTVFVSCQKRREEGETRDKEE